jgi:hypothetical protein
MQEQRSTARLSRNSLVSNQCRETLFSTNDIHSPESVCNVIVKVLHGTNMVIDGKSLDQPLTP